MQCIQLLLSLLIPCGYLISCILYVLGLSLFAGNQWTDDWGDKAGIAKENTPHTTPVVCLRKHAAAATPTSPPHAAASAPTLGVMEEVDDTKQDYVRIGGTTKTSSSSGGGSSRTKDPSILRSSRFHAL